MSCISYITGGRLGDFFQQLSVVYDYFLKTGKKGIIYLDDNVGDNFRFGAAQALEDMREIIALQPYIEDVRLHNGEPIDVDLTLWRSHIFRSKSHSEVMEAIYNVEYGKHKWLLNIPTDQRWSDITVINTVHYRFPDRKSDIAFFNKLDLSKTVFVSFSEEQYNIFIMSIPLPIQIPFYRPANLMEVCIILNSCKLMAGSLSAFMTFATALHKDCVYPADTMNLMYNMDKHMPMIKYTTPDGSKD